MVNEARLRPIRPDSFFNTRTTGFGCRRAALEARTESCGKDFSAAFE
jgi:hypothetical protein